MNTSPHISLISAHLPTVGASLLKQYPDILSAEEQRRANDYNFQEDGDRFRCGRTLLRLCLAEQLQKSAADLCFDINPHGKLTLPVTINTNHIVFSLSKRQDWVVIALSQQMALGVDVEYCVPTHDNIALAEYFFREEEATEIKNAPQPDDKFYQIWSAKEAYVKALGLGLTYSLKRFQVQCHGEGGVIIDPHQPSQHWTLWTTKIAPNYRVAVLSNQPEPMIQQQLYMPQ